MRLRGFTAVGMAMLFLLSGLPLTAQSPSSSAPPPVSIRFSVPSELERLRGELERELSQRFREAGEGLGVPLPRNNPVPGMSIGIFPDGTFAAVVPARGLASLPSVLRGRTTLGLLYLSAPGGQLPSGFYRMELSYGPRSQVILTGVAVGGRSRTFAFPASLEDNSGGDAAPSSTRLQWKPVPSGGEVCVSVTVGKISVVVCIRW